MRICLCFEKGKEEMFLCFVCSQLFHWLSASEKWEPREVDLIDEEWDNRLNTIVRPDCFL